MKSVAAKPGDFSHLKKFPGESDNFLDLLLHRSEKLEKIPGILFAGLLLLLAFIPTAGRWQLTIGLWGFFLSDWLLLYLLPRAKKSFGPAKPPTLALAILRMIFAFLPVQIALPLQVIGSALVIYGFWIEPHRLTITYQKLTSPYLHNSKPIRILHLGDLHIERITQRERRLNQAIKELKPDLILFSGDIINLSYLKDPVAWQAAREIISEWQAPLGVYAVTGSPAVDLPEIIPELIKGLPVRWLENEKVSLDCNNEKIDLIGVHCSHRPFIDGPELSSLTNAKKEHFSILLYHTPDLAPQAAHAGIDLQLSGHTHGGQCRLPFFGAIMTGSLYGKNFEAGRREVEGMTLYVTRGIGMEGCAAPRVRFLCPPEIILWEISQASN